MLIGMLAIHYAHGGSDRPAQRYVVVYISFLWDLHTRLTRLLWAGRIPNWALVITHSPANQPLAKLVFQIFNGVLPNRISELPIPDHLNLDAPTYPPPSDSGEIIVHGESLFSDIFMQTMGRCFDVKKTKDTMHGLDEYYETSSGGAKPVWIEIENGNPVKENCTK
jgi:hypothetical protein